MGPLATAGRYPATTVRGFATAVVTTAIRRSFDARSTVYQRSLSSRWRNQLAAVTLVYLFRPQCRGRTHRSWVL